MTFPIPAAALAHHMAALGKTGSGKTSTTKLIVEHVADQGFRVCVLDTVKSDWWGIISSADGQHPGLPFRILGGPHGHVALPASAGAAIGKLVGEGQLPLSIIDMADFAMGGPQHFFVDFAAALMRHMRGVLYLVIEEAHELAPKERAGVGGENMAIHWAKKLATAGRSKGIRLIVATQRVQSLHNAVLGSCETLIAHRFQTPADQKPIVDWVKANVPSREVQQEVAQSLSSLPTGTAWLCSGEAQVFERVAFPKFRTFDNTATPLSDDEAQTIKTAPVDTKELRAIIGHAVEEAEENDPKALKRKLAELQKGAPTAPSWPDLREDVDQLRGELRKCEARKDHLVRQLTAIGEILVNTDVVKPAEQSEEPEAEIEQTRDRQGRTVDEAYLLPERLIDTTGPMNAAAAQIAGLLKRLKKTSWESLFILGGFRPASGWILKAKKELKARGLVEEVGGLVRATDALLQSDIPPIHTPSPAELRALWDGKLRGPGGVMIKWLATHGPSTKEQIADGVGYSVKAGWTLKGFKDIRGSNLAVESDGKLIPNKLLVD